MNPTIAWINNNLKSIDHEIFKDVVKVEDATSEPMGDGQLVIVSDLKRITLKLVTANGTKKRLNAVCKSEPMVKGGKEMADMFNAFRNEFLMYGTVLKGMKRIMDETKDKNYLWPECYYCSDSKFLFQDLCDEGYKIVPAYKPLDLNHVLLVMKGLGRFHGTSMVMKERGLLDTNQFKPPYFARRLPFMDDMYEKTLEHIKDAMTKFWGTEWTSIADRVVKYMENPGELIQNAWKSTLGKWDVLNHGDFTIRNMMFQYDSTGMVDSVRFLDFQMTHYSNLANDLVLFLFSSVKPQIREDNLKLILNTYVESLKSTCQLHGLKRDLPSVQDVELSLNRLTPLALSQILTSTPFFILTGKQDLQSKANEFLDTNSTMETLFQKDSGDEDLFHDYRDPDVMEYLQYELKNCINKNIF